MSRHPKAPSINLQRAVADQVKWIEDHGGTEATYVRMYGLASDKHRSGDGGEAIYAADIALLRELEMQARITEPSRVRERVFVSINLDRPWHILVRRTDFVSPDTDQPVLLMVCKTTLTASAMFPGWPKQCTMEELRRLYPASVVCRQCSDNEPL